MKAEGFPQMQLWKLTHVHVISEISDKTVLKGAKWSSCSQQSCQSEIIYSARFLRDCHCKADFQEKDKTVLRISM